MLSEDDLRAIEARAAAATPGPWKAYQYAGDPDAQWMVDGHADRSFDSWLVCGNLGPSRNPYSQKNADFIAHSRTDVPALVAALREVRAAARAVVTLNGDYDNCLTCGTSWNKHANYCVLGRLAALVSGEADHA